MIVKRDFYVGFRMVEENLEMKSGEMLNIFIDIAGIHSESVGDGFDSESRWILTGYNVKIYRKPRYMETVTFITWSRDYNQAIATREFEIRDKGGNLLVCALSQFVRFNIKTRKFDKITNDIMLSYESENSRTNFGGEKVKRFMDLGEYDGWIFDEVDWKWIDLNHHMNNSHYIDLALHTLKSAGIDVEEYSFEINYKQEIKEGERIKIFYKKVDKGYTVAIKSEDEKTLFAGIEFYK